MSKWEAEVDIRTICVALFVFMVTGVVVGGTIEATFHHPKTPAQSWALYQEQRELMIDQLEGRE